MGQCAELPDRALSSVTVIQTIGDAMRVGLYTASFCRDLSSAVVRPEYCIMELVGWQVLLDPSLTSGHNNWG